MYKLSVRIQSFTPIGEDKQEQRSFRDLIGAIIFVVCETEPIEGNSVMWWKTAKKTLT